MNFIPSNGWPQLKDIPEKLEHFREVYARFAKVNRWYQSIKETELTGNPVIFEKALKLNATALSLNILTIQSGSGDPSPENVRPISGRTEVNLERDVFVNMDRTSADSFNMGGIYFDYSEDGSLIHIHGTSTVNLMSTAFGSAWIADGSTYVVNSDIPDYTTSSKGWFVYDDTAGSTIVSVRQSIKNREITPTAGHRIMLGVQIPRGESIDFTFNYGVYEKN